MLRAHSLLVLLLAVVPAALGADLQTERLLRGQEVLDTKLEELQRAVYALKDALVGCPAGWERADDSCFRLFGGEETADDAQAACAQEDPRAHLANLRSNASRDLAHALVDNSPYERAWIGLRLSGESWRWTDGKELAGEDDDVWLRGQPDNNGGEECVMYDRTARYSGWTKGWSDERCVLEAPYLCEITLSLTHCSADKH